MKKLLLFLALLFGFSGYSSSSKKNIAGMNEACIENIVWGTSSVAVHADSLAECNNDDNMAHNIIYGLSRVKGGNTNYNGTDSRPHYFLVHNKYGNDR